MDFEKKNITDLKESFSGMSKFTDEMKSEMERIEIKNRKDIEFLVRSFYNKVRKDELIGDFFNSVIGSEENWENHFQKLTDFWQTNLLNEQAYKGSPMQAHQKMDKETGNQIEQEHFDRWLKLWKETVEELYIGERADRAYSNAQNIATFMLLKMKMVRN